MRGKRRRGGGTSLPRIRGRARSDWLGIWPGRAAVGRAASWPAAGARPWRGAPSTLTHGQRAEKGLCFVEPQPDIVPCRLPSSPTGGRRAQGAGPGTPRGS